VRRSCAAPAPPDCIPDLLKENTVRRCPLAVSLTRAALAASVAPGPAVAKPRPKKPKVSLRATGPALAGSPVRLTLKARAPKGRKLTRYTLAFGDGSRSQRGRRLKPRVTHTYAKAGGFTLRLTVTDNRGQAATATLKLNVTARPAPAAPVAAPPVTHPAPAPLTPCLWPRAPAPRHRR
jgi:hypothetical protein